MSQFSPFELINECSIFCSVFVSSGEAYLWFYWTIFFCLLSFLFFFLKIKINQVTSESDPILYRKYGGKLQKQNELVIRYVYLETFTAFTPI